MSRDSRHYLIVDDNRPFAENLAEILVDRGADVTVVESGAEALKAVGATPYAALLTDMRMPLMNGAQLVHEIRRVDPALPALVMTAYTGDNDLEDARREGLLAVLPKPVPVPRLVEHLEQARRNGLVALVEDDEALRDNLSEALRMAGFAAVLAGSVLETDRLGCVQPFAAVVDLRVPGGPDGEAMRKLSVRYPGMPMLVITAHRDVAPPFTHEAFFTKPFDTGALLARLLALHQGPRA